MKEKRPIWFTDWRKLFHAESRVLGSWIANNFTDGRIRMTKGLYEQIRRVQRIEARLHVESEVKDVTWGHALLDAIKKTKPGDRCPKQERQIEESEEHRGNRVAKTVWAWLQKQKAIQFVPWVLDPRNEKYDPAKAEQRKIRDQILAELERVILDASKST